MTSYLVILTVLMLLSLGALYFPHQVKVWSSMATAVLVLFAGLRFQTGYDWPSYESYFRSIVGVKEALCDGIPRLPILAEPLYLFLNMIVKSFTSDLTVLFFIVALLNLVLLHYVISKISKFVPVVWMLYFGVVFLIAQMTTIRQGIASSLVILGLYYASTQQLFRSSVAILLSMGFHISTLMFVPIVLYRKTFPSKKIIYPIIIFGLACVISGINLQYYFFNFASTIPSLWMAPKIPTYLYADYPISIGSIGLMLYHCFILALLETKTTPEERKSPIIIIAVWLTLATLIAHLYFSGLPSVWNRVMFVSIPWQIATIYRLEIFRTLSRNFKLSTVMAIFFISAVSLIYSLEKPNAEPYKPYYSVIENSTANEPRKHMDGSVINNEMMNKGVLWVGPRRVLFEPLMKSAFDNYCKKRTTASD